MWSLCRVPSPTSILFCFFNQDAASSVSTVTRLQHRFTVRPWRSRKEPKCLGVTTRTIVVKSPGESSRVAVRSPKQIWAYRRRRSRSRQMSCGSDSNSDNKINNIHSNNKNLPQRYRYTKSLLGFFLSLSLSLLKYNKKSTEWHYIQPTINTAYHIFCCLRGCVSRPFFPVSVFILFYFIFFNTVCGFYFLFSLCYS